MWGVVRPAEWFFAARHSQQLPGWSQYAEPALCQAGFRQTCLVAMWTSPATATAISVIAAEQEIGAEGDAAERRRAEVDARANAGDRSPRAVGDDVWSACAHRGPDQCTCDPSRLRGRIPAGGALGIVGVCGARIGFASLAFYGSPPILQGVPDPMSGLESWRFLRVYEAPIAIAVGSSVLIALWLRRGREVGATKASSREARSRRIGAVGEARVAGELKRIGLPALHNVILCGHSLRRGVIGRARSPGSCGVGDRGAGNQDLRRNDRGPTRVSGLDTAHGRRRRARRVGQSGAAEPGACTGIGGFSGRPAGADMRLRRLGRPCAVCTGDRGRGRFRSRSTMGAVDFLCRSEPARPRCGVAAARA